MLHLDATDRGPDDKARFDWLRKQFAKLDLQLEIRGTDYNRFQEKVRKGAAQMFIWGWNADYPDPENFMFLFHSAQSRARFQGENAANYANPEYDRLFERMKAMPDSPARQAIIDRMIAILHEDAPWSFGFHPKGYQLSHAWLGNLKPNQMARNDIKYRRVDAGLRDTKRAQWNRPNAWPLVAIAALLLLTIVPAWRLYRRRERAVARPNAAKEAA